MYTLRRRKRNFGVRALVGLMLTGALSIITACGSGSGGGSSPSPVTVTSIAVTPASLSLIVGQTQQLTATAQYSNGTSSNVTASVTWSAVPAQDSTISAAGLLTASSAGTVTITASMTDIAGTDSLTVNPRTVVSIAVTPSNASLLLNASQQFDAVGKFNDGTVQDISSQATWSSSSPSIVAVSKGGKATGVSSGLSTITARRIVFKGLQVLTSNPLARDLH